MAISHGVRLLGHLRSLEDEKIGCQAFFLISLDVPGGEINESGFYLIQVF